MLVGIDEVGRGSWAGPLVAGAAMLCDPITGLADSKQLTRAQREPLAFEIMHRQHAFGLGWVTPREVDALGLTGAVRVAMQRALEQIPKTYSEIIIDGNFNFLTDEPRARTMIHADATVPAVSAASIIAKVARDEWMRQCAAKAFPVYGFEKHVGYGTKLHRDMLKQHGICSLHRQSYRPVRAVVNAGNTP